MIIHPEHPGAEQVRRLFHHGLKRCVPIVVMAGALPMVALAFFADLPLATWGIVATLCTAIIVLAVIAYALHHYRTLRREIAPLAGLAAMGRTTANVAHDLRGPLTSLRVAMTWLGSAEAATGEQFPKYLELLQLSASRLQRVAEEVLQQHETMAQTRRRLDLRQLLGNLVREYRHRPDLGGVTFALPAETTPVLIDGVPSRIERLFANLFKNGIEAMEFEGRFTVTLMADERTVAIGVADTGPGFTEVQLAAVQRQAVLATTKADGHGIGIGAVRQIVQDHGGTLTIGNAPEGGACFTISLQVAEPIAPDKVIPLQPAAGVRP